MKTKFEINELLGIGITLVVFGVGIAYGLQVMGDIKDDADLANCDDEPPSSGYTTYNESAMKCTNTTLVSTLHDPISAAWNASKDSIEATGKLPEKLPTIATVIVASVIIGILITYLWGRVQ